jgi:DNA-binding transcriptional regulator YiaG
MDADQIRKLRENLDLSIRAFADKIGVDKNTVVHWEKNRHRPKGLYLKALERLAKRAAKEC